MLIEGVTYQTVVDQVVNYIATNCVNISNFSGLSSVFKSGYSSTTQYAGNTTANAKYTITLTSGAVLSSTAATVTTAMDAFLTATTTYDLLDQDIKTSEIYAFMDNMLSFCASHVYFTTSQLSTAAYMIYSTDSVYEYTTPISNIDNNYIVTASDIDRLFNIMITDLKDIIRTIPVQYSITVSN